MLTRWMIRVRALLRGTKVEAEFDEELRYHLDQQVRRNVEQGMGPKEARSAALREFGNPLLLRDQARETWRWRRLDEFAHDTRYAARALRHSPGFAVVAVLSLGFGIGTSTTLFGVVDAVDFRPLPYPDPDRLFFLAERRSATDPACPSCPDLTSAATAADWRAQTSSFAAFGLQGYTYICLEDAGVGECPDIGEASAGFFGALGVRPALGRVFLPGDSEPGAEPVVVLSHKIWQQRFGGDPDVIGRQLEYAPDSGFGVRYTSTIVGVLPEGFRWWREFALWRPLVDPWARSGDTRSRRTVAVVARLEPGVEPVAAQAELRAVQAGLAVEHPDVYEGRQAAMMPLRERFGWSAGRGRGVLFAITVIVLSIAVLNVAGLFAARAVARHQEFCVRRALGASRGRLVRQLLVEGAVLGIGGGVVGCTLALWGVRVASASFNLDSYGPALQVDHRVLAFGVGVSLVAGVLAALLPTGAIARPDLYAALREPMAAGPKRGSSRLPGVLLVGQIGAALVLLTGAGLLGTEYLQLRYLDIGYDPSNLYELRIAAPDEYREQPELLRPEAEQARTLIEAITGVASASLQYRNAMNPAIVRAEDRNEPAQPDEYISVHSVDFDYFETMATPILAGRTFTEGDGRSGPLVAVLDRSSASRFWPGRSALGRQVFLGDSESAGEWVTVIGVVEDVERGEYRSRHQPRLYRPLDQAPIYHPYIGMQVRAANARPEVLRAVESALHASLGRTIQPASAHEDQLGGRFRSQRINAIALNLFAAFALLLAAMGIYGSVAYSVTRRTREVGVRVALGADRARVLALFARHAVLLAIVGLGLGCIGSVALTRVLQSFVAATSATDLRVLGGAALLMAVVVVVATYLPARRATTVDPAIALRSE